MRCAAQRRFQAAEPELRIFEHLNCLFDRYGIRPRYRNGGYAVLRAAFDQPVREVR